MDYREKRRLLPPRLPNDGDTWGRWKLRIENEGMNLYLLDLYWIPVWEYRDKRLALIDHMAEKSFVTANDIGNLVFALEDIYFADNVCFAGLCPSEPGTEV